MNETRFQETWCRSCWSLVAGPAGFLAQSRLRGDFAIRRQVAAGCVLHVGREREPQWRHQLDAQADEDSRLDEPGKPRGCRAGVGGIRTARANAPRIEARLQPVRLHPVSAGLRLEQAGHIAGKLPNYRLHGRWGGACGASIRIKAGHLAPCQKNAKGIPATGQSSCYPSRHGTNAYAECSEMTEFVPPREKTPAFSVGNRPATGHLSRLAISPSF